VEGVLENYAYEAEAKEALAESYSFNFKKSSTTGQTSQRQVQSEKPSRSLNGLFRE
jgi:hypothetical protein